MSDDGPTVAAIRAGLVSACALEEETPLALAFRSYVLGEHDLIDGLTADAAEGIAGTGRQARHVAVLGYAAAAGRLPYAHAPALADGIRWLSEHPWNRPLREETLEADGVSMLGVSLGARGSDALLLAPLAALAVRSAARQSLTAFTRSLFVAAAHVLAAPGRPDLTAMLPEVRVALSGLGLMPADHGNGPPAWRAAMRLVAGEVTAEQAALTLRAFDALCERNLPARLGRLEAEDVLRVLQGVVRSFREWTWEERSPTPKSADPVRWHIENEYHVQNMLWAVLAPLFPDLEKEGYTRTVGHKNPRMDLAIPSLKLVVEVKFMRPGKGFADILEELAADHTLYVLDRRWEVLIPFVWDDSRRVEQHATLLHGLRAMPNVLDAVVMSRPGRMEREPASSRPSVKVDEGRDPLPAISAKPQRKRRKGQA